MRGFLLYHPFGNQNVYGVLHMLDSKGILAEYHTSCAFKPKSFISRVLRTLRMRKFLRKEIPYVVGARVICHPFWDIVRRLPFGLGKMMGIKSEDVNTILDKRIGHDILSKKYSFYGAYAYANGAERIFQSIKCNGGLCIYDLPIAYYKEVLRQVDQERLIKPEWIGNATLYSNRDLCNQIDRELELADIIIVASTYVRNSLIKEGYASSKIHVIPYGFPKIRPKTYRKINDKLKLLYVGGLSQMKGFSYMMDAYEKLQDFVELSIIGGGVTSQFIGESLKKVHYLGTMSHERVLDYMKEADILLFPSLSDGFGLVVSEAMSQGTPAIVSDHCGAMDVIQDGVNGWIVPSRDSESIVNKIHDILNEKSCVEECGKKALSTALERSWIQYGDDIYNVINNFVWW